jgi:hypothetical protein
VKHVTLQMLAYEQLKVFSIQNYLKQPLATQISRSNACRLLSLGPIEGQSVQKYTPHNRKLKDAIRQEIQAVNFDTLGKVFQNLEKRIQICLDVKGDQFPIVPSMCI